MNKLAGQMMACMQQCQQDYMICQLEEDEEREEAETAARVSASKTEDCDCSCAALDLLERRAREMETQFKPGDPAPLDEIGKMSQCMNACQSEFVACHMK